MDMGQHAIFIWTAYGATALVVAGLIARAILDERSQKRALIRLEAEGVRRRSQRVPLDRQA
jgi:heme exporter protein D